LADGSQVDAENVISNADYKTTFLKLIDPSDLENEWRSSITKARQTRSIFQVCLGIDKTKADLSAFREASRIIFRSNRFSAMAATDLDWLAKEVDPASFATQEMEVSLWSREDPRLAPPGHAVIVIRTEADHGHFKPYRPKQGKRTPAYRRYKTLLARALVKEATALIPSLENAIEVFDVATPLTFEERGGRSEGAVAGWSWDFDHNRDRPLELVRTPISGLYMAGYQAYSALFMGGVPTALLSGLRAAQAVVQGDGPMEHVKLPG
jgi:phytoene dehydrogenase-like protein